MRVSLLVVIVAQLAWNVGCACAPKSPYRKIGEQFSLENRIGATREYLAYSSSSPGDTIHDRVIEESREVLRREGQSVLMGRAACAVAQQVGSSSHVVLIGTWFEAIPSVVDIELYDSTDGRVLWSKGISMESMANNYTRLTGLAVGGSLVLYGWDFILEDDDEDAPASAREVRDLAPQGRLAVRLLRADDAAQAMCVPVTWLPN